MTTETFEGTIERITYYNEETSYSVLRIKPHQTLRQNVGRDGLATVVGALPPLQVGEVVRFGGTWTNHPEYGRQFKAETASPVLPTSLEGLRRYLASGFIKGIGSRTADAIIAHFGLDALKALNENPDRIREVPGIGSHRAQLIAQGWAEQFQAREVMVFLQGYGVGTALAKRIYNTYGDNAMAVVRDNPYQLARDIQGIGFKIADRIARSMGLATDALERIEAGVIYALETLTGDGHVYAPRRVAFDKITELLELPRSRPAGQVIDDEAPPPEDEFSPPLTAPDSDELTYVPLESTPAQIALRIGEAIDRLTEEEAIFVAEVPDDIPESSSANGPNGDSDAPALIEALYSRPMYFSEKLAARKLQEMTQWKTSRLRKAKTFGWIKFFSILETQDRISLTPQQRDAVEAATNHKLSILTGGPGTGKTTTLRAVIRALEVQGATYALASPTGRAAKRLTEATGRPAKTIHRLLGFMPGETFEAEGEPLDVDMLIIDESSMLDLVLFYNVLKALSPDMHLMLVGDVDQLPSVGAGDVLRDLIKSGIAHVTRLDTIFRQADDSQIIANAHRINHGEIPVLDNQASDFFMFGAETPESAADLVVDLVTRRIPDKFGFDAMDDIQVLAPMYRGGAGIQVLNERLQAALNPPGRGAEKRIAGSTFRVGDKVMQTRNNYDKDVYNGDIGRVRAIDFAAERLHVVFDGRPVEYHFSDVDELLHAYAVSVHRSQGSEYPVVVVPVMPQHFVMLQRNLLYTAVTRAKQLVVMVGMKKAVAMAVRNDKVARRYSGLAYRLQGVIK